MLYCYAHCSGSCVCRWVACFYRPSCVPCLAISHITRPSPTRIYSPTDTYPRLFPKLQHLLVLDLRCHSQSWWLGISSISSTTGLTATLPPVLHGLSFLASEFRHGGSQSRGHTAVKSWTCRSPLSITRWFVPGQSLRSSIEVIG